MIFSKLRSNSAEIEAKIKAGTTVVVDRYYYSGAVYSAAKDNPNLSLRWARKPDEGLPRPDICLFLDLSAEDAAKRGGFGTEKYENTSMQARVRQLFAELQSSPDGKDIVFVDGGMTVNRVQSRIRALVEQCMKSVANKQSPLRRVEPW